MSKPAHCNGFIKTAITYAFIFLFSLLVAEATLEKVIFDGQVKTLVTTMQEEAKKALVHTRSDLIALSLSPNLHNFIENKDELSMRNLEIEFLLNVKEHPHYDQIRYIDETGQEIVRVNSNNGFPVIVSKDKLRNKSDRYYFSDTMKLHEGDVFVSPNDLNQEEGLIETPYKPTMRLATPFVHGGKEAGILIINYNTSEFFSIIDEFGKKFKYSDLMILNSNGYWLASENNEEEWGFMWAEKSSIKFDNKYPSAWKRIVLNNTGDFYNEEGYFRFSKFFPIKLLQSGNNSNDEGLSYFTHDLKTNDFYGVYLIHMSYQQLWDGFYNEVLNKYVYAFSALVILIIFLRCPENLKNLFLKYKESEKERKMHQKIKFYV